MFKGKFSLLFFLTVSVTFLFFFNTTNEASPDPAQTETEETPKLGRKMAAILGKKATLVVGSVNYSGEENEIRDFWNGKKDAGYQSVDFTLVWAFIVSEEIITEEMGDYDHIAYEHFTFSLIESRAGKILKNQDGRGERSCRHIYGCECRTR